MFQASLSSAMLEKSLDALWQRNQLVMNNIANEDTPGYKAKRLDFENLLRREISARTNVTALDSGAIAQRALNTTPRVYEDNTISVRADGNNVDIDSEHIEQARIQLQWNLAIQKVSGHYTSLKYAIAGGR